MPAERLYYADSALTQFAATVTDIRERSRTGGASLWQVALDRSAFYPTSGGQPHDTGTLTATAPSGTDALLMPLADSSMMWIVVARSAVRLSPPAWPSEPPSGTGWAGRVPPAWKSPPIRQGRGQSPPGAA